MEVYMKKLVYILIFSLIIILSACAQSNKIDNTNKPEFSVSTLPAVFKNKNDLIYAIENQIETDGNKSYKSITFFFEPKWVPKEAHLISINVKEEYCCYVYTLDDKANINDTKNQLIFEWYMQENSDAPKNYFEKHKIKYKNVKDNKNYYMYTVTEPVFTEDGSYDSSSVGEPVCYNVFWSQDGYSFHGVIPLTYSEDDIMKFCDAKMIKIK